LLILFKGRISAAGFIPKNLVISSTRDTTSTSTSAIAPESVLFRQKHAPTRYVESDIYFANERSLKPDLPESETVKAIHCYTSDFYSRATASRGVQDWRSLDETALLALGVLLEESCRSTLGQSGDLVFTEGERVEASHRTAHGDAPRPRARSLTEEPLQTSKKRVKKKRRVAET
jgi:hypothetical protein